MASSIYYYAGLPLGTWLILHNQPVRAALLRGSTASMILTGAAVRTSGLSIWVALLAPSRSPCAPTPASSTVAAAMAVP